MMYKLLVGSQAMKLALGNKFWKTPVDHDYVVMRKEELPSSSSFNFSEEIPGFLYTDKKKKLEFFIAQNCPPLKEIYRRHIYAAEETASLNTLLIMKNAHKHFYMGKFRKSFKHLIDYSNLLKHVQLSEEDKQLSLEYRAWLIENAYNNDERLLHFPKLDKSKEQFFNDHVTYYVDHDWIHELVAIDDKPAYTKCLTGEVMFSNKLFNKLDYDSKVKMVLEESFVLALERCLVPMFHGETYLPAVTPSDAFQYAFVRVATNITSGDFRDFAADNFSDIWNIYQEKHVNYFKVIDEILKKCLI